MPRRWSMCRCRPTESRATTSSGTSSSTRADAGAASWTSRCGLAHWRSSRPIPASTRSFASDADGPGQPAGSSRGPDSESGLGPPRPGHRPVRARPAWRCASRPRPDDETIMLPGAGLPWFLTLFGRDTLITAYQTVAFGPRLARGALDGAGARSRARRCDDFRDEEPGKIPHELRSGELTVLGLKPHSPYYGSADATILWLILLSEYWRWTGDDAFVLAMRDDGPRRAGLDRRVTATATATATSSTRPGRPQGLGNQCWRDSLDGVLFTDGSDPRPADRDLRDPGLCLRRQAADGGAGRRAARRPRAGRAAARRGRRPARAVRPRLLDRRAGRLLRDRPRWRQAARSTR